MVLHRVPSVLVPSVLVLSALAAVSAGDSPPQRPAGAQDVLYLAADRPLIVRFHVLLDGRTPERPLHAEFSRPMQPVNGGQPFGQTPEPDGAPLFACIDADNDGRLSEAEFQRIAETLHKLDLDDDETISAAELEPLGNPFGPAVTAPPGVANANGVLVPVSAAQPPRELAKLLIARYDRTDKATGKDNRLSPEELGLAGPAFAAFDADDDAGLDFHELTRWIRRPAPAVEVVVRLGNTEANNGEANNGEANEAPVQVTHRGGDLHARIRTPAGGPAILTLGSAQIEIGVDSSTAGDRVVLQVGTEARNLFETLDRNGDRRLSPRELRTAAGSRDLWDQDDDGSVSQSEIPTHVRLVFSRARPVLEDTQNAISSSSRTGPVWFPMMDRNGDGDLSRREFLGPIERFRLLDADRDGLISAREASARHSGQPAPNSPE